MSSYHAVSVWELRNNMLNSSIVSRFWPRPNVPETGRGNRRRLVVAWQGWHCTHVHPLLLQIQIQNGNSCIHMCLDYTTLLGNEGFFCGGESRAQGAMGGSGAVESFSSLLFLWMRYCLVVEHSWETSAHVSLRSQTCRSSSLYIKSYNNSSQKKLFSPLCLCLIFLLSSLSCVFFPRTDLLLFFFTLSNFCSQLLMWFSWVKTSRLAG